MKLFKTTFNPSFQRSSYISKRFSSAVLILVLLLSSFATAFGRQDKAPTVNGTKPTTDQSQSSAAQSQAGNAEKTSTQTQTPAQTSDSEKPAADKSADTTGDQAKTDRKKPDDQKKDDKKADPGQGGLKYPLPDLKPLGSAGGKTVHPTDPTTDEFIPMPDRWRFGWPRFHCYQAEIGNDLPF